MNNQKIVQEKNEMNLKFLNKSENEFLARTAIMGFVSYLNPPLSWMNEIKTAVSEGVTNSIIHAYGKEEGYVELKAKVNDNKIIIEIKDEGKGISDIEKARKLNFHTNENSERAGMGFQIMEAFVDKIDVKSKVKEGTTVTLEKELLI